MTNNYAFQYYTYRPLRWLPLDVIAGGLIFSSFDVFGLADYFHFMSKLMLDHGDAFYEVAELRAPFMKIPFHRDPPFIETSLHGDPPTGTPQKGHGTRQPDRK